MEVEDRWDVGYSVEPLLDPKYSKRVVITIKNHSPFLKNFKIWTDKIRIDDQLTNLRFRMYFNLTSPIVLNVEKYKKAEIELKIPRLEYRDNDKIEILIEEIGKRETKRIEINLK